MAVFALSDEFVDQLICPSGRRHYEVFDTHIRGLYVDVQPGGRMAYRLRFRVAGRARHTTLGDARILTVQEARSAARERLRLVLAGHDPTTLAQHPHLHTLGPTVQQFFETQYLPYVQTYKRSWSSDQSLIRTHIVPRLGPRWMAQLRAPDFAGVVQSLKAQDYSVGTINRVLVLLRFGYALALRWQVPGIERNPMKDLKNLRDESRIERYLTTAQLCDLMQAARASSNLMLPFIVGFLVHTGARKREALDAQWHHIDRARRSWRIPRTKSGQVRHVPLSGAALALLDALQAQVQALCPGSTYLFPNPNTGAPFRSVFISWNAARRHAGLPELRVHDLRHSFASFLVNAGRSLYEVKELLGHADLRTTTRYSHLSRERLFDAVEAVPVG